MPQSFALRIESGQQAGETHAISGKGLTVGRRPGNDLVIHDASVSGRHARFSIEGDHVVLVDLASTNGSFVDDQRIEQHSLSAGAFLRLGKIELELVLIDSAAEPAPAVKPTPTAMPTGTPPPRHSTAPMPMDNDEIELELELDGEGDDDLEIEEAEPAAAKQVETLDLTQFDDDQDGMHAVDQAALAKTKGSRTPALVGLILIAGAAGWYFAGMPGLPQSGDPAQGKPQPVATVAGNLVTNPSFENGLTGWTADEEAALVPFVDAAWRVSGATGIGASLEPGETTRVASPVVSVSDQRLLKAGVAVTAEGGASARLGIEFSDNDGTHAGAIAWSAAQLDVDGDVEFEVWVPAGFDRARLVLAMSAATEAGSVGFDDAFLVASSGSAPGARVGDFVLTSQGDARLALGFIDRPLLLDMTGAEPRVQGEDLVITSSAAWGATVSNAQMQGGLATLGASGFAPHADEFTDPGVESIVIGHGVSQIRILLPGPATVSGRPVAGGYRIETDAPVRGAVHIETGFADERARAARLAQEARLAETKAQRGQALGHWQVLLDEVPFDQDLVATAEANRGRLITSGLEDLAALADDFERAKFFGLPDLYRECLADVKALQTEFASTEVAAPAAELAAQVAATIQSLGSSDTETLRLQGARQAVLDWAQERGSDAMAEHLKAALEMGGN